MKVAPELEDLVRPMTDATLLPGNPRHGDVEAIAESLRRFGQRKPVVIDPDGVILAGNHLYQAALLLGWEEMAFANTDDLSPEDRQAYVLADNRLSDLGGYDNDALAAQLREAADLPDGLDGTGYSPGDVDFLELLAAKEHVEFDARIPGHNQVTDVPDMTCPNCGHVIELL